MRFYLLAVLTLATYAVVSQTLSRFARVKRAPRRQRLATAAESRLPPFFERAERREAHLCLPLPGGGAVTLALAPIEQAIHTSAGQFEQVRQRLREIAEQRLARRGLRLNSDARDLVGEKAWLLLAGPPPADRFAPGPPPSDLRHLIEALEQI